MQCNINYPMGLVLLRSGPLWGGGEEENGGRGGGVTSKCVWR